MDLIQQLNARFAAAFAGCQPMLTEFAGERVGGTLVWNGFDGLSQLDRQRQLRAVVRELPVESQLRVTFILSLTSEELAAMTA